MKLKNIKHIKETMGKYAPQKLDPENLVHMIRYCVACSQAFCDDHKGPKRED